jgi:hypothetical protein
MPPRLSGIPQRERAAWGTIDNINGGERRKGQ